MKKIVALLLLVCMLFSFVGCNKDLTHSERVKKEGKLVVGITECPPMNYKENGEWTGFDTEFAKLFASEKLGVEVVFKEIDWSERFTLLDNGEVDCIWNGLTVIRFDADKLSTSKPYLKNSQVLVMKADRVENYKDGYEILKLKFVVEKSSAGAFYTIERNSFPDVTEVKSQLTALDLVSSGKADITVVDKTLAEAVTGKGKRYEDLGIGFKFSDETFCVGFPKESDITAMLDEYMDEIRDTKLSDLANKYGVTLHIPQNQ